MEKALIWNNFCVPLRRISEFDRIMESGNYISFGSKSVKIKVSIYTFKENGVYIAYCPSLDISGYDHDETAAIDDFRTMLSEYISWQLEHGTLDADLASHGWSVGSGKGREPGLAEMLVRNEQLRNIVTGSYSKTNLNTTCAHA